MRISRRAFIQGTVGASLVAGVAYPTLLEPFQVAVESIQIPLAGLPAAFAGFKIVQLSDLHFQPFTTLRQIAHVVDITNTLDADLVVITGDFITLGSNSIEALAPVLGKLRARYGIAGVLGNHDQVSGSDQIATTLNKSRIEILRNYGRTITHQGARIYLAGIDSVCEECQDLTLALAHRPPGLTTILLAHEPDFADLIPAAAQVALQLSGHSHGGQICLPFAKPLILPEWGRKYWRGLRQVGSTLVYTNRGIGTSHLPARFGSVPEITRITLQVASPTS